ncbi:hypothetical protein ACFL6X_05265 [Candidatus Latescibacterota bacterium]
MKSDAMGVPGCLEIQIGPAVVCCRIGARFGHQLHVGGLDVGLPSLDQIGDTQTGVVDALLLAPRAGHPSPLGNTKMRVEQL